MVIRQRAETTLLFVGDLLVLALSLYVALFFRSGHLPTIGILEVHSIPFLIIFAVSIIVYFIAGLYEAHTVLFRAKLPTLVLHSQITNAIVAVSFFYFVPFFGITPKTILFIYLVLSSVTMLLWRVYGYRLFASAEKENAILIGSGAEMRELREEVNQNSRYKIRFIATIDPETMKAIDFNEEVIQRVYADRVSFIAVNLRDERIEPVIPHLYNLIFSGVKFVDMHKLYEEIFRRIPLSQVRDNWFLENISATTRTMHDTLKRIMDVLVALVFGLLSLVFYPFICAAIKLEDGGPIFIMQERVGKNRHCIRTYKFRSMERNELDPTKKSDNRVTRIGSFLRRTRLDELPQLWSVLTGDQSLVGPRPELPSAVKLYEEQIPYYNVRHLIKPGLSGWAQLHGEHAHHGTDVVKTTNKLSYDLYYIKNRSFMLDLKIALQTLKVLISRSGI